jgi:hypothetical protein
LPANQPDRADYGHDPKDHDYQGENSKQVDAHAAHAPSLPLGLMQRIAIIRRACGGYGAALSAAAGEE